jgi:hypothetical protein
LIGGQFLPVEDDGVFDVVIEFCFEDVVEGVERVLEA